MAEIAGSATNLLGSLLERSQWRRRVHDIHGGRLKRHQGHLLLHVSLSVVGTFHCLLESVVDNDGYCAQ